MLNDIPALVHALHYIVPIQRSGFSIRTHPTPRGINLPYLDEPDILALLPETLAADVETVFADQTGFVGADAAV